MNEREIKERCEKAYNAEKLAQGVIGMVGVGGSVAGSVSGEAIALQQHCDDSTVNRANIYSQAARARENAQSANKESDRLSELVFLFEKHPDVKRILELLHITV